MEYFPLRISPRSNSSSNTPSRPSGTIWRFPNFDLTQTSDLLASFEIPHGVVRELTALAGVDAAASGIELFPNSQQLCEISPDSRARLYHWLGETNPKSWHTNAFRHLGTSVDDWLAEQHLAAATIKLVRAYVYRHGPYLLFADLPAVAAQLADRRELQRLTKALAGEVTVLAQLHVRRGDNLDQLVALLGARRANAKRAAAAGISGRLAARAIDRHHPPLALLCPPKALYLSEREYRRGQDDPRDCHWTSLNFFNETPDDRFLDMVAVAQTVARDWQPSNAPPLLGDLVFFHDEQGTVFHSAVYIADNILFTKNGPTPTRPWVLMPLDQMLQFYPAHLGGQLPLLSPPGSGLRGAGTFAPFAWHKCRRRQ